MPVKIREYYPDKLLQPYVELFWEGDFNPAHRPVLSRGVVPNGFVELVIHQSDDHCELLAGNKWSASPDYTIIGLYTQPYEVQFRKRVNVFGIRFKPEGIYNLFGIPASVFSERYEDMRLVLDKDFDEYSSRLREAKSMKQKLKISHQYLLKQAEKNHSELGYVNHAAELIRRPGKLKKIEELPQKVYISLRQLERQFKKETGITPKQYMRIMRLNEVHRKLESEQPTELTQIAFDCGYADQAHFIRDFKNLMGLNPSDFGKKKNDFIVNVQQV